MAIAQSMRQTSTPDEVKDPLPPPLHKPPLLPSFLPREHPDLSRVYSILNFQKQDKLNKCTGASGVSSLSGERTLFPLPYPDAFMHPLANRLHEVVLLLRPTVYHSLTTILFRMMRFFPQEMEKISAKVYHTIVSCASASPLYQLAPLSFAGL